MLLALLLSVASFFVTDRIGNQLVEKLYMNEEAVSERQGALYGEFASFVHANNISCRDAASVSRWSNEHKYATVYIYNGQSLNMRVEAGQTFRAAPEERANYLDGKLYTLRFSDAICRVAVSDGSEAKMYAMVNIAAFAVAGLLFIIIMMNFFSVQTRRIIMLSREASVISAGNLEAPISTRGRDEIAMLAKSMERMRNSVIERMGSENRALQANQDLITAISHDIRTPMTSMLAYLGMLNEGGIDDPEQAKAFISTSYKKAVELKELTDELFKYFLVYGKTDPSMEIEQFDASLLIEQLAGEAEYELADCGFITKHIGEITGGTVEVDALYLKRVMDNIVSNIKKYADTLHPVIFLIEQNKDRISVCVSNTVAHSSHAESTKLGIRTCEKIMEKLNGKFLTSREEEHFTAELILPLTDNEKS